MRLTEFIEAIRADFANLAELAGPENGQIITRAGSNLAPAFAGHLLDALNALVAEYNLDGPGPSAVSPLTVHVEGDDVRLSSLVVTEPEVTASPSEYSARIALRLTDDLKSSIEHLAEDMGSSVNSWIVRTLERSVRNDGGVTVTPGSRQLRGRGRA